MAGSAALTEALGAKIGLYFSNADKCFEPSLVLLTYKGEDQKFPLKTVFLIADTTSK